MFSDAPSRLLLPGQITQVARSAFLSEINKFYKDYVRHLYFIIAYCVLLFVVPWIAGISEDSIILPRLYFLLISVAVGNWFFFRHSFPAVPARDAYGRNAYGIRTVTIIGIGYSVGTILLAGFVGRDIAWSTYFGAFQIVFIA